LYIERLVLNEFRAIAHSDVEFTHPTSPRARGLELRNINVLVGTNGGGKSTVLKGIAAAVLGDVIDLESVTGGAVTSWPRIGATGSCQARVTYRSHADTDVAGGPEEASGTLSEAWALIDDRGATHGRRPDLENESDHRDVNLFGYGPQRVAGENVDTADALDATARVANLFEQTQTLIPPESWLPELDDEELDAVNRLMPPEVQLTGGVLDGLIEVENRGLKVSRAMLSDGAQSYMAWMLDLVFRLRRSGGGDFRSVRGTVLVDEVDQRMHPAWQQLVLAQLADGLPNLQFICSAHSPLLAGGLRPENLTVLEPDHDAPGDGAMKASHFEEDVYGRTSDGVLTSSYFNLASSRSEQFRQELRRLADQARTMDQAAIDFIEALSGGSAQGDVRVRSEIVTRPDRLRRRR
jgi:hypothetical protein